MLLVRPLYQKHNKVDDKRQRHYKAYNDNKGLFIHTCLSVSPSHTREHKKGSAPKNAQRKRLSPTRVKRSAVLCIKSTSLVLRYTGQTVGEWKTLHGLRWRLRASFLWGIYVILRTSNPAVLNAG